MDLCKFRIRKCFSDWVRDKASEKKLTQAELIISSGLSRTTINRIFRNSNDKGSAYEVTMPVVKLLSVVLALNREEATEMLFSAFPDMELWGHFLDKKLGIAEIDIILDENGFDLWGRTP
jgi:transcriptional regulator with XRE-family HTH domain